MWPLDINLRIRNAALIFSSEWLVSLDLGVTVAGWLKIIMGWTTPGASQLWKAMETSSGLLRGTQWKVLQMPSVPLISKMENISTTPRSADNPKHFTSFEQKRPWKCPCKDRESHNVASLKRNPCHWSIVRSYLVLSSFKDGGHCLHPRCRTRSRWVNGWQFN